MSAADSFSPPSDVASEDTEPAAAAPQLYVEPATISATATPRKAFRADPRMIMGAVIAVVVVIAIARQQANSSGAFEPVPAPVTPASQQQAVPTGELPEGHPELSSGSSNAQYPDSPDETREAEIVVYQKSDGIEDRLGDAAAAINSDLASGNVSDSTLDLCAALLSDAEGALSEACNLPGDSRGGLLVAVLEQQVIRAQALVDGSNAARSGGDFRSHFQTGRDAKKVEGWVYVSESQWELDPNGDLARLRSAFFGGE